MAPYLLCTRAPLAHPLHFPFRVPTVPICTSPHPLAPLAPPRAPCQTALDSATRREAEAEARHADATQAVRAETDALGGEAQRGFAAELGQLTAQTRQVRLAVRLGVMADRAEAAGRSPPTLILRRAARGVTVLPHCSPSPYLTRVRAAAQVEAESERLRASHEADRAELVTTRRTLWAAQQAERLERDASEHGAEQEEGGEPALRAEVTRLTGALLQAEAEAAAAVDSPADPAPAPSQASAHSGAAPTRTVSFGRPFGRRARAPDGSADSGAAPARALSFGRKGARAAAGAASLLSRSVRRAPNNGSA